MNKDLFDKNIVNLESGIFEVEGLAKGDYDEQAVLYDKLISNSLYNRIMWGNTPKDYANFCVKGLESNSGGVIADIGCGTLGFTHMAYAKYPKQHLFLCDLSYEMLKIGKERIEKINNDGSIITFLRADAFNLPFKANTVQTALNFGLFHIFDDPTSLVREIVRVLKPGGQLFLTSLCTDRNFSGKYLNMLHKKGHVAKPLHSSEIKRIIEENGIEIFDFKVKGGMTYISGGKK